MCNTQLKIVYVSLQHVEKKCLNENVSAQLIWVRWTTFFCIYQMNQCMEKHGCYFLKKEEEKIGEHFQLRVTTAKITSFENFQTV